MPGTFLAALIATAAAASGLTIAGEPFPRADILDARTVPDGAGAAALLLTFMPAGSARLHALTAAHDGQPIAIALDGRPLAQVVVHGAIDDGQLQVPGSFGTFEAAAALAKRISGKDPLPETGD